MADKMRRKAQPETLGVRGSLGNNRIVPNECRRTKAKNYRAENGRETKERGTKNYEKRHNHIGKEN